MAKDPAILWYWNDWQGGTSTFTRHLKGCYMDLLNAQFNTGKLSLAEIKTVLGTDFGSTWPTLQKKFKEESGLFFNERMEEEKQKRKAFSESRRKNLLSKKKVHMPPHMEAHMENENANGNDSLGKGGMGEKPESPPGARKWTTTPGPEWFDLELPEISQGAVIQHFRFTKHKDVTPHQVQGLWAVFKANYFTAKKFYQDKSDVYSHFLNWSVKQEITEKAIKSASADNGQLDRLKSLHKK
jgi:hypothetical protein